MGAGNDFSSLVDRPEKSWRPVVIVLMAQVEHHAHLNSSLAAMRFIQAARLLIATLCWLAGRGRRRCTGGRARRREVFR